jgi:hypothetical protein
MNKYLAALMAALGLVASGFTPAAAGVLMNETETMVSGQPNGQPAPPPRQQTMMIQGNKQKTVVDGGRVIITDLDKGTTLVINPAQKNYFERPFPPPGRMGAPAGGMHASEFTKTGKTQTVAGYKCEDYNGSGKFAMGDFTVVSCISTGAPGSAEFSAFQKKMTDKLKDTPFAMPANLPDGIPLVQNTTTKMSITNMPNLPPQAAEQLKKQFANRPPIVTKIEVTKVEAKNFPASEFEVPADYTKREPTMAHPPGMGMGGGMGSRPMAGGSGGSSAANLGGGATAGDAPLTVAPPPPANP